MDGNVEALRNLYRELGGDPAVVANCRTSVEILNAISAKYGGADNAIINPDAINAIAAIASSIGGGGHDADQLRGVIERTINSSVIPDGAKTIGDGAFSYCTELESVVIPDSVTTIGNSAFFMCSRLKSVVIPDSVTTIGNDAFHECIALESVVIPDSVTTINNSAFYWCSALKSVVISDGVRAIYNYAFAYCSALESVVIPDSVTTIDPNSFQGVSGTLYCRFSEGAVDDAPWGATGTIVYDYNG